MANVGREFVEFIYHCLVLSSPDSLSTASLDIDFSLMSLLTMVSVSDGQTVYQSIF